MKKIIITLLIFLVFINVVSAINDVEVSFNYTINSVFLDDSNSPFYYLGCSPTAINITPTIGNPLTVCAYDGFSNLGCNSYTNGTYGNGDIVSTNVFETDSSKQYSLKLIWNRIEYLNGTHIGKYDAGEYKPSNDFICGYKSFSSERIEVLRGETPTPTCSFSGSSTIINGYRSWYGYGYDRRATESYNSIGGSEYTLTGVHPNDGDDCALIYWFEYQYNVPEEDFYYYANADINHFATGCSNGVSSSYEENLCFNSNSEDTTTSFYLPDNYIVLDIDFNNNIFIDGSLQINVTNISTFVNNISVNSDMLFDVESDVWDSDNPETAYLFTDDLRKENLNVTYTTESGAQCTCWNEELNFTQMVSAGASEITLGVNHYCDVSNDRISIGNSSLYISCTGDGSTPANSATSRELKIYKFPERDRPIIYNIESLSFDDGCSANISLSPTSLYNISLCYLGNCVDYTSGEYGVGSHIITDRVDVWNIVSNRLQLFWNRVKYESGVNSGFYDHGGSYTSNNWECWMRVSPYSPHFTLPNCAGSLSSISSMFFESSTCTVGPYGLYESECSEVGSSQPLWEISNATTCRAYEGLIKGDLGDTESSYTCTNLNSYGYWTGSACGCQAVSYSAYTGCSDGVEPTCPTNMCDYAGSYDEYSSYFTGNDIVTFTGKIEGSGFIEGINYTSPLYNYYIITNPLSYENKIAWNYDNTPTLIMGNIYFKFKTNETADCYCSLTEGNYTQMQTTGIHCDSSDNLIHYWSKSGLAEGHNNIYCSCDIYETKSDISHSSALPFLRINNLPEFEELYLDKLYYYTNENIYLSYQIFDIDIGDNNQNGTLEYSVYINDVLYKHDFVYNISDLDLHTFLILNSGETDVNDEIYVVAKISDGETYDETTTTVSYIYDYSIQPPDYYTPYVYDIVLDGEIAWTDIDAYCSGISYYSKVAYEYEWYVNNVSVLSGITGLKDVDVFSYISTLNSGNYSRFDNVTFDCRVVDYTETGNTTSETVEIQNSPPNIINTEPYTDEVIVYPTYNFSILVTDYEDDTLTYYNYLNDVFVSSNSEFTYSSLVDKTEYVWKIVVNDGYDNTTLEVPFYVSLFSPAIRVLSPKDTWFTSDRSSINVLFYAYDPNGTSFCDFYVDGVYSYSISNISDNTLYNFTINNTADQNDYIYNIYCEDTLGYGDFYYKNFTTGIDTIEPDLFVYSPAEGTYRRNDIPVTIETTETFIDECSYELYYAFADILKESGTIDCDYTSTLNVSYYRGGYLINFIARDIAGNIDSEYVPFYSLPPLPTDDEITPTPTGGGGGTTVIPGLELEEFYVEPTTLITQMTANSNKYLEFVVVNTYVKPINVVVEIVNSQLSDYMRIVDNGNLVESIKFEITNEEGIGSNRRFVQVYLELPSDIPQGNYNGTVYVTSEGGTIVYTVDLKVTDNIFLRFVEWLNIPIGPIRIWVIPVTFLVGYIGIRRLMANRKKRKKD